MVVAKELSMTLGQLREAMTPEELQLWLAFRQLEHDENKKAIEKAKRRR